MCASALTRNILIKLVELAAGVPFSGRRRRGYRLQLLRVSEAQPAARPLAKWAEPSQNRHRKVMKRGIP
jgi:hypothetical protein